MSPLSNSRVASSKTQLVLPLIGPTQIALVNFRNSLSDPEGTQLSEVHRLLKE